MNPLKNTLPQPKKATNIPHDAQWLSGEGAGSWFSIKQSDLSYDIQRFSPDGKLECEGKFKNTSDTIFDIHTDFEITHLSHCQQVTVIQDQKKIRLILA